MNPAPASTLAMGTKISGTLPLHDLLDRRAAHAARQTRAIIDKIVELKISAFAVAADEIAQRAAAFVDRGGKRCTHGGGKQVVARERDAPGGRRRPDARAKEAFRGIDVAHADHDIPREQRLLDGNLSAARASMHQGSGKPGREWLDAQCGKQRMLEHVARLARMPKYCTKAAWVTEAQNKFVENPVDVIVLRRRGWLRDMPQHAQGASHAEMDDEPAVIDFEQKVLAASLDFANQLPGQRTREIRGHRPAQRLSPHVDSFDAAPGNVRLDSAPGDFNFWELGHV